MKGYPSRHGIPREQSRYSVSDDISIYSLVRGAVKKRHRQRSLKDLFLICASSLHEELLVFLGYIYTFGIGYVRLHSFQTNRLCKTLLIAL